MFGIESENWFSLFKRGVELLADMSTFQFTAGLPELEKRKQFPKQLQSGNVKGKIPHSRSILVKKAQTASFKGHGVPQQLGMASHSKWARCPTEKGQSVPASILQLGEKMVRTFFPHRCDKQVAIQSKAASDWINETAEWQQQPWYEPIRGYLQIFGQSAGQGPRQCPRQWPRWAFLQETSEQAAMVAKTCNGSRGHKINNPRCDIFLSPAQLPFSPSLLQKSRGNPNMAWETIQEYLEVGATK